MTSELGRFLRARRARTQPADLDLAAGGVRRVAGLRREELALVAGISPDYYTRIEQGRVRPSPQILEALAAALRLDDIEREHLRRLGTLGRKPSTTSRRQARPYRETVRDGVHTVLDHLADLPAVVLGRHMDALAWTPVGGALLGLHESGERNMARRMFLLPETRRLYPDWNGVAAETVGHLRRLSVERVGDVVLARLIGELAMVSAEFARLWSRHDVHAGVSDRKAFRHPQAGTFELEPEVLVWPRDQQTLCVYRAVPASAGAEALPLLHTLVASDLTSDDPVHN
ncbi:MmyB family transcriptional regulator [Actinomadura rudentiformis]|uniref:Helix-turn-helix domain-containing protein n=1 Tax=Actinomadura rudentiformis TaxID=359158 RepID=A0A6H9YF47_9ACTN|nr:helix-turn-helix domain-containing protein [Actinomadura rudentiformis]KAB2340149.1 helix-turn-helix domain-containing protein [Actinomadura rudentiformis]